MVKQKTLLPGAGSQFECVVPMEVNLSASFPALTLPVSEKDVLFLRPLLYSNRRTFQHVCYVGADGRFLADGEVSADRWARDAAATAARYDPGRLAERAWGRPAEIRQRVQALAPLAAKNLGALRAALDAQEDPAVLMQVIQRVRLLKGDDAAAFWTEMIAWPNLYVQMIALRQLQSLGPGGLSRAVELVQPHVERERFGLDSDGDAAGPRLYRDVPGELATALCKTSDPAHARFVAAVFHSVPNWYVVDEAPDYFQRVAPAGKREVARAIVDALSWPDSRSHPLTNPFNRPRIARMCAILARFGCPVPAPDWNDPAAGIAALTEVRRWWEGRTEGK